MSVCSTKAKNKTQTHYTTNSDNNKPLKDEKHRFGNGAACARQPGDPRRHNSHGRGNGRHPLSRPKPGAPSGFSKPEWRGKKAERKPVPNHLLNFKFEPRGRRSPREPVVSSNRYSRQNHYRKSFSKEEFLQANCQFVVSEGWDHSVHTADPDVPVPWDKVQQVWVWTEEEWVCPICLYPPIAAKTTPCGHIYCSPCILHYLALDDAGHDYRKCPICNVGIGKGDLRSVLIKERPRLKVDDQISMQLMCRGRGETIPHTFCDSEDNSSRLTDRAKIFPYSPLDVLHHVVEPELEQLKACLAVEADNLERVFVKSALEECERWEAGIIAAMTEDSDEFSHSMLSTGSISGGDSCAEVYEPSHKVPTAEKVSETGRYSLPSGASVDVAPSAGSVRESETHTEHTVVPVRKYHRLEAPPEGILISDLLCSAEPTEGPVHQDMNMVPADSQSEMLLSPLEGSSVGDISMLSASENVTIDQDADMVPTGSQSKMLLSTLEGCSVGNINKPSASENVTSETLFSPSESVASTSTDGTVSPDTLSRASASRTVSFSDQDDVHTHEGAVSRDGGGGKRGKQRSESSNSDLSETSFGQADISAKGTHLKKKNKNGKEKYYFYQCEDGRHLFLHGLNVKCMQREYGKFEKCPSRITGKIVSLESFTMTEELRKRHRYLLHLPLLCEYSIAELELSAILSTATLAEFKDPLQQRAKQRRRKENEENRRLRHSEAMAKQAYSQSSSHWLESAMHAPTATGSVSVLVTSSAPSAPHATAKSSWGPEAHNDTKMSFAQMLRSGEVAPPKPRVNRSTGQIEAVSDKVESQTKGNDSDDPDYVPPPTYQSAFEDALTSALDSIRVCNNVEDAAIQKVKGRKGKKGKKKQTLIFSTSAQMQQF